MRHRDWVGLCLAGGQSVRFGGEKAVALLGGHPLMAWSLAALTPVCGPVLVSALKGSRAEALANTLGYPVISDNPGHARGPLAGIAAGLAWAEAAGHDGLISLPCDTPLVGSERLAALIDGLGPAPAAFAVTDDGAQGLCAVWTTRLAAPLEARLSRGDYPSVHGLLADLGAAAVHFRDATGFRNINTSADLALAESEIE